MLIMPHAVDAPQFWQSLYDVGQSQWNLGTAAPAFIKLLASPGAPTPGRLIVPGCGRGYDALLFGRHGFEVVGVDFADAAVAAARRAAERGRLSNVRFEQADLFHLPREWDGTFDYALEYTCFCAVDPARRTDYVAVLTRLLRPGGELIALFYPLRDGVDGPPFPSSEAEIRRLFSPAWDIMEWTPRPEFSIDRRRDFEALVRMRRRG
jgi:SAM-dependent methyltransferase